MSTAFTEEQARAYMHKLLATMSQAGGSDLFIASDFPASMKSQGAMKPMTNQKLTPDVTRMLAHSLMNESQRAEFAKEMECNFAISIPGVSRFRVNVMMQQRCVSMVIRTIASEIPSFEKLKLPETLKDVVMAKRGLVLVVGATGSGKSTSLAAMIDAINETREEHIMTVEDPIEFLHGHKKCIINQREVGSDAQSFALALKAALRQDPDVILVGEMRDLDTISTALTAAETGHLVFATLHTQSAPQTIDRVIDVFPAHQQDQVRVQLSVALMGVMTQQLLPTADGAGRVVACEVLVPTPAVRNLIREGKTHQIPSTMQTSSRVGMQTMDAALATLIRAGKITQRFAEQRSSTPEELRRLLGFGMAA